MHGGFQDTSLSLVTAPSRTPTLHPAARPEMQQRLESWADHLPFFLALPAGAS